MLQEDYLMRMIRLATSVFARILGLKQAGSYLDALAVIDQALEVIFGLNPTLINTLDDDSLLALLTTKDGLEVDKLLILAGLLKERGAIYAAIDRPVDCRSHTIRALNFYLELFHNPTHIPPAVLIESIEEILSRFSEQGLPDEIKYPLFFYFEQTKQFANASHMLSDLQVTNGYNPELGVQAREFYNRLLDMSEEELKTGKISRDEVRIKLGLLKT
jgi:hypothetical protein